MRLRSAMTKILKVHNNPNAIKPQEIEEMEKSGLLDELKAEDENIVSEIIALTHEVYNTYKDLKNKGTEISELEFFFKILKNPSDYLCQSG